VCLFIFTALQGLGGWVLIRQGLGGNVVGNFVPTLLGGGSQSSIVPALINLMADAAPLLVGILAVCALAAMQSTGSAYMSTAGGMITRDIYLRYINPQATASQQKFWGRVWVVGVAFAALMVATFSTDALVMLGGLAVSFGTQMWIPLAGNLYFPWLTRQGVVAGLAVGLVAVMLTYPFKYALFVGIHKMLGIGAYPLTIHCAGWGIMFNALVAVVVSALTQPDRKEADRRAGYHKFLADHAGVPAEKAHLKTTGWVITIVWLLFAIGPFATIGNNFLFWNAADPSGWPFGMPPLWLWQIVWWLIGVYMMYFLAYKLEFSTHFGDIESLREDIQETYGEKGEIRLDVEEPGV
jgi:Na+/proline symporter